MCSSDLVTPRRVRLTRRTLTRWIPRTNSVSAEEPADPQRPRRALSPAAQAAIARYKRTLGNVADSQSDDESPARQRSDLERHLVDRPPHWAPPHRDRPSMGGDTSKD